MKSFVFSICALAFIIVLVICNTIYVNKSTESLIKKIESIDYQKNAQPIIDAWEKDKFILCFSVTHKETDKIEESIYLLDKYIREENFQMASTTKFLLINYIEQIRDHEKLTINNIL